MNLARSLQFFPVIWITDLIQQKMVLLMQDNRNYSCRLVLDLTTSFYRIVKCVSNNHKHICCRKMHLTIDPNVRSNCNVELLCLFHSISKNTINQLIACINCVCNPTKSELNLF